MNSKSTLARTAILLAAKRAACNNTNNYDGSTFTLIDGAEDEADSNAGLFKQRFDILDFTDDVCKLFRKKFSILVFSFSFHLKMKLNPTQMHHYQHLQQYQRSQQIILQLH
jgi:hypothetical protein